MCSSDLGVEQTPSGITVVVLDYKGFRVAIPLKEMMLYSGPVPHGAKYKPFMERMNGILSTMLTAEIDFIVRGLNHNERSAVASRKAAMLRKRQTFYLDTNEDGEPLVYEGRVVQARVIGVAEKSLRVDVFGVECTIFALTSIPKDGANDCRPFRIDFVEVQYIGNLN